jgi:microcystin-dependent protein
MATPYLSEIKIVSFGYPPKGWALCNGQIMSINQNSALFSLVGTTYGGDGMQTFGLPNLQGRVPVHMGAGYVIGELGGEVDHTLIESEMPAHTHQANGTTSAATSGSPTGNLWCSNPATPFNASSNASMAPQSIGITGGSQPHPNMSPFLALYFCIALQGIFPSQS